MITITFDSRALHCGITFRKVAIYLDTWALIHLAECDAALGRRFIALFDSPVDLLFSVTNAAELAGSHGASFDAVKAFLDAIGPCWIPAELSAFDVAKREEKGTRPGEACLAPQFLKDYFASQIRNSLPNSGGVIDVAPSSRLGPILDWVVPQRHSILQSSVEMDNVLQGMVARERGKFRQDKKWLDKTFGGFAQFNQLMPATFVLQNLVKLLVVEGRPIKPGDGLDFCHAVVASAFSSFAALDKHWKRRIEKLPKPNKLAKIYYAAELDKMVADVESWLDISSQSPVARQIPQSS